MNDFGLARIAQLLSHWSSVIDRIHIEQLELSARVGVSKHERAKPQRIACNITISVNMDEDFADDVANTVDYSAVAEWIKAFAAQSEFRLIETLADNIARGLLNAFPIRKAVVEVRKFVLSDADFVSVTASQTASEG